MQFQIDPITSAKDFVVSTKQKCGLVHTKIAYSLTLLFVPYSVAYAVAFGILYGTGVLIVLKPLKGS